MSTNYGARPGLTVSAEGFALRIGRTRVVLTVASFAEASRLFLNAQRAATERGCDMASDATLYDVAMTRKVARLSQNGKVWPLEKWYSGQQPLFDPYDDAQARGSREQS